MSVKSYRNASGVSSKPKNRKQLRIDWHEAATCAFQIELRDYSDILEYITEYVLGKNYHRIDLLIIKKLSDMTIPKNIALILRTFNLMEIKGLGSSVSTDSYYKIVGYAGLFIEQTGEPNQYSALDVSLTFLSLHYPRKLMKHLREDRKLTVANVSPGYIISIKRHLLHRLSSPVNFLLKTTCICAVLPTISMIWSLQTGWLTIIKNIRNWISTTDICSK